jgi:hypothetical protein
MRARVALLFLLLLPRARCQTAAVSRKARAACDMKSLLKRKHLGPGLRFSDAGNHVIDNYLRRLQAGLMTNAVLFVFMASR